MRIFDFCPKPGGFREAKGDLIVCSDGLPGGMEAKLKAKMEFLSEAYFKSTGRVKDLTKISIENQRLLAALCENMVAHHAAAVSAGRGDILLNASAEARQRLGIKETVTTSDIATFTTQQLAYVVDVFAPFIIQDVVTTVAMTGPTAFVHRQVFQRGAENVDCAYDAGAPLSEGLDPSCSECPTECEASNGVDLEITAELIEADCRRLSGKYCIPANYHFSSQYGGDLGSVLMQGITIELRRAIQADILANILANAGGTANWNRTPTVGSYFETANPNEWKRELWNTIKAANRNILKATDGGRVSGNILLGDVDGIGILEDTVPMDFVDQQPGDVSHARGDEMSQYFARTKQERFAIYRFLEGLPTDTLILMNRNDRDPTYVYAPWIPITSLGMLVDPETAQVKIGAITLYGQVVIRPNRIQHITIGA